MKDNQEKKKINFLKKSISDKVFDSIKTKMPTISQTEQDAIDAGDTWIEADIFKGDIDWDYILESNIDKFLTP